MKIYPKHGFWKVEFKISTEDEKGRKKKTKEVHLYDAVNPTDAETQAAEEMQGLMCEWEIERISKFSCSCVGSPEK